MMGLSKRERGRPFYITSLPAYLHLQARCADGPGMEPRAVLPAYGHHPLAFLAEEAS